MSDSHQAPESQVVIALGANVGEPLANLQRAIDLLSRSVRLTGVSRVYQSAPMYVTDQPEFLNAAVTGFTSLGPLALLRELKEIEQKIGRRFRERNGPREVDLDLILFGSLRYRFQLGAPPYLEIPHARATERAFVLAPLADIAPDLVFPGGSPVKELLAATKDQLQSVQPKSDGILSI